MSWAGTKAVRYRITAARGGSASFGVRLDSGQVFVAMTNRGIPIEPVNGRVGRAVREELGPDA